MAIKTKEELLTAIRDRFADDSSDETISFIEDVSDTITDLETKAAGDGVDWKAKATEIDNAWREKYKARFFAGTPTEPDDDPEIIDEPKPLTFDELFKEE